MGVTRPDTTSTMSGLSNSDIEAMTIALVVEGLFYGVYSGLFVIFLHHQSPKKDGEKKHYNIIFYSICALYALSVVLFAFDLMMNMFQFTGKSKDSLLRLSYTETTLFGLCDFIAQFILIYRCWIVWGRNIHVVVIPSILAFAFLACWLASNSVLRISPGGFSNPRWVFPVILSSLTLSLIVNALVTGLIVFKILKVFRQVKVTSNAQILGSTGWSRLQHTILVLIESGMALFCIQLVRLVVSSVSTDAAYRGFLIVLPIHDMVTGITPTVILVRLSMGLSFHDKKSMEEVAMSLMSNHPNSVMPTGTMTMVDEDDRGDDIDVQKSKNIS